ncbi:transposase [Rhizobium halophytocola]|uniref:Transposase n=1 Tax=Rhizobium halophytocola TaxID=735519 RepID=A0ABS4E485_9HYPH|nr:transposase [Rhizobium halophytocola]
MMTKRSHRNHSHAFKAKVALVTIKGEKTMVELAQQFDIHPNQIKQWKDQLLDGVADVFDEGCKATAEPVVDIKSLHTKIGEMTPENSAPQSRASLLRKQACVQGRTVERKAITDRHHKLSVCRQARIHGISRGSVYYLPQPALAADLVLMRRIDELHLDYPSSPGAGLLISTRN